MASRFEIIDKVNAGIPQIQIAKELGISKQRVSQVVREWKKGQEKREEEDFKKMYFKLKAEFREVINKLHKERAAREADKEEIGELEKEIRNLKEENKNLRGRMKAHFSNKEMKNRVAQERFKAIKPKKQEYTVKTVSNRPKTRQGDAKAVKVG